MVPVSRAANEPVRTAEDCTVAVPSAPVRVVVQAENVPLSKPSLKSGPPAGGPRPW